MRDDGARRSGPKLTHRQLQAKNTKEKIYTAALDVIREKGYAAVSIEDITEAAGVAKGSFYTHFDSKESLLRFTYDQLNPIYLHAYQQVKGCDFPESLCAFIQLSFTEREKLGKEILTALATNYFSDEFIGTHLNYNRQIYTCLDQIITAAKRSGVIKKDVPTTEYVRIISSVLIGAENSWCLVRDSDERLVDFAVRSVRFLALGMMAENNPPAP